MDERTRDRYIRNIERVANVTIDEVGEREGQSFYKEAYHNAFCNFEKSEKSA